VRKLVAHQRPLRSRKNAVAPLPGSELCILYLTTLIHKGNAFGLMVSITSCSKSPTAPRCEGQRGVAARWNNSGRSPCRASAGRRERRFRPGQI